MRKMSGGPKRLKNTVSSRQVPTHQRLAGREGRGAVGEGVPRDDGAVDEGAEAGQRRRVAPGCDAVRGLGLLDLEQPRGRDVVQPGNVRRGQSQQLQRALGAGGGAVAGGEAQRRGAFDRGLVEQPRGRRHGVDGRGLGAAAALAPDHDVVGVAAEVLDVLAGPAQRGEDVQHPLVGGVVAAGEVAQEQVAQQAEPVVGLDHDHVVELRQMGAVLPGGGAGADHVAAAVVVEHHRPPLAVGGGGPDVEVEAVLGGCRHPAVAGRAHLAARRLERRVGEVHRVANAGPPCGRLRGLEPQLAQRRRGIGHAEELDDAVLAPAPHLAVPGRRLVGSPAPPCACAGIGRLIAATADSEPPIIVRRVILELMVRPSWSAARGKLAPGGWWCQEPVRTVKECEPDATAYTA